MRKEKAKIDFKQLVMQNRERMRRLALPTAAQKMKPDQPEEQIKRPFLKSYEKTPSSYGFTSKLVAKREGG